MVEARCKIDKEFETVSVLPEVFRLLDAHFMKPWYISLLLC